MNNLPDFIKDLAIILIMAGIVTIVFKKLKQPVVLGYIVAGFLASLHFKYFAEELIVKFTGTRGFLFDIFDKLPEISDMANVTIWADIGVIFLLFALGLDFSFKKLIDVGGTAAIATFIVVVSMCLLGFVVGQLLGWSQMDSIFLGGMLSMSSTTIIIKSFNDFGLQKRKFAGIVFAMLIVEDLFAVLLLVLLSAIAVSSHFEGTDLLFNILKLVFFLLIWFLVGIYVIPSLLKKLKPHLNDETLLVVAVGLCLGMVYFATSVGFSSALGAFVMGSILAETIESKHIEHLVTPLKNLFGAIFFVSVGMMLNPHVIIDYAPIIIILALVVTFGRFFFSTMGVLASGQSLKIAVQAGCSVALIGEFSYIIASLGMDLGVISDKLYPIIVSVSVVTIFTGPYLMKSSDLVYGLIEKRIPKTWTKLLEGYGASSYNTVNKQSNWKILLKSILGTLVIYGTLCLATLLINYQLIVPMIEKYTTDIWALILNVVILILITAPFMRSIMLKHNTSKVFAELWDASDFNKGILTFISIIRILACLVLVSFILIPIFGGHVHFSLLILISAAIVATIILAKGFRKRSLVMEERFLGNLYSKERIHEKNAIIQTKAANKLKSKELHVEELVVSPYSPSIGKTLRELNFRQNTGVNIMCIIRGNKKINIPDGNEFLFPNDTIIIIGSDNEIQRFMHSIEERNKNIVEEHEHENIQTHIDIAQYTVDNKSLLIGQTVASAAVQDKTECMIIGIDRDGDSLTEINSSLEFKQGDVLWLAGETKQLDSFEEKVNHIITS